MEKFNKDKQCPKCGMKPTFQLLWQLAFQHKACQTFNSSYNQKCSWSDPDVGEHLHATCPDCGFQEAFPTEDYEELKVAATNGSWTTTQPVAAGTPVAAIGGGSTARTSSAPRVISGGQNRSTYPVVTTPAVDPWETECADCPCPSEKTEAK